MLKTLAILCDVKPYALPRGACTIDEYGFSSCVGRGASGESQDRGRRFARDLSSKAELDHPCTSTGDTRTGCGVLKSPHSIQALKECDLGRGCGYLGKIHDNGCHTVG